jgi:hypothetical protein
MKTLIQSEKARLAFACSLLIFSLIAAFVFLSTYGWFITAMKFLHHAVIAAGILYLFIRAVVEIVQYRDSQLRSNPKEDGKAVRSSDPPSRKLPSIKTMHQDVD